MRYRQCNGLRHHPADREGDQNAGNHASENELVDQREGPRLGILSDDQQRLLRVDHFSDHAAETVHALLAGTADLYVPGIFTRLRVAHQADGLFGDPVVPGLCQLAQLIEARLLARVVGRQALGQAPGLLEIAPPGAIRLEEFLLAGKQEAAEARLLVDHAHQHIVGHRHHLQRVVVPSGGLLDLLRLEVDHRVHCQYGQDDDTQGDDELPGDGHVIQRSHKALPLGRIGSWGRVHALSLNSASSLSGPPILRSRAKPLTRD